MTSTVAEACLRDGTVADAPSDCSAWPVSRSRVKASTSSTALGRRPSGFDGMLSAWSGAVVVRFLSTPPLPMLDAPSPIAATESGSSSLADASGLNGSDVSSSSLPEEEESSLCGGGELRYLCGGRDGSVGKYDVDADLLSVSSGDEAAGVTIRTDFCGVEGCGF